MLVTKYNRELLEINALAAICKDKPKAKDVKIKCIKVLNNTTCSVLYTHTSVLGPIYHDVYYFKINSDQKEKVSNCKSIW